jgi:hypothetical protein
MSHVPSRSSTVANMCHTLALAYRVTIALFAPGGHSQNSSRSQFTRTPPSRPFTLGTFTGGSLPRNATTHLRHIEDSIRLVTGRPLIDNPRIIAMSSRVTVISPHGRWKEWVFDLHLSTIAVMAVALNTSMPRPTMLVIASRLALQRRGM